MKNIDPTKGPQTFLQRWALIMTSGWNYKKYWHRRSLVVSSTNKIPLLLKLWYLYYIKKVDGSHNCSFGTMINSGATFATPPYLPQGPNGIIVGHDAK